MLHRPGAQIVYPMTHPHTYTSVCISNARVISPADGIDDIRTVCIKGTSIESLGAPEADTPPADVHIDAQGCWLIPGITDMHVHLREPGREDKETIATGTNAAAAGGITAVACMPNTTPALDEESSIRYVRQRAAQCASKIYPVGAITKRLAGEELAPFGEMVQAGACAVTDDHNSVKNADMMKNACNYAKNFDIPLICHCEDTSLSRGGHMNESEMSTRLGIPGIPSLAEEVITARDIMIAEYTGARVHIAHVSTAGAVELIREAKHRGVQVTAETCPHYISLTDEALADFDTHKKMNPPLRTAHDRAAVIQGLIDGTIDVITTDHAPHVSEEKKEVEFIQAAFGVIGMETSVGIALTHLVAPGHLSPSALVEKMCVAPNRILSRPGGTLAAGAPADIALIAPQQRWVVDPTAFYSKARNCPFEGWELTGCCVATICEGRVVYTRGAMSSPVQQALSRYMHT
jgi:dihydroorotase